VFVCLFLFLIGTTSVQATEEFSQEEMIESTKEELNIGSFLEEANRYTKDVLKDFNMSDLLNSAMTGSVDNKGLFQNLIAPFGDQIKSTGKVFASILVIILIHSVLKSITDGLENKSVAQITYYVEYILIVTVTMANFTQSIAMCKTAIQDLASFSNCLIPILITLMLTTGSIASASMIEPILLFLITFISNFIVGLVIPFVLISTSLKIISSISKRVQVDKLAKFFNTSVVWVLGVALTLFVGVVSLEGTLSSTVDGITAKTAKAAVSNFIPVVGKILGDAVDTVIGCSSILKNAVGLVGVVVVLSICIIPVGKLLILMWMYKLAAALCQPLAEENIVALLEHMSDAFKILFAIICSVSVMLIIGVTLVVRISNAGLMYR